MTEKYWFGGANHHKGQWDYDGIAPFNLNAGEATDGGTGLSGLPATAHGLYAGDEIVVAGTDNYDGTFILDTATTADKMVIPLAYTLESGTNGLMSGIQFTAAGIDLIANGVQPGMILRISNAPDPADDGDYVIDVIIDSWHLNVVAGTVASSGLTFQIIRPETFDGTEIVTPNVDSNWKRVADGTNASVPEDGDVLHFNDRAFYDTAAKRYQDCTVNIDGQGTGTPNLDGLFISAGFNGNIGTADTPLQINCQDDDIVIDGECTLYLKLSAGEGADAGCGRLVVNNEKANVTVSSLLNDEVNVCLYTLLVCLKGYLWIGDNCAVGQVVSANYNCSVDGGIGIEDVKNQTPCSVTAVKGEVVWRSKIDQIELFDAEFAWGTNDMAEVSGYTCNLLTIYSKSGEFIWQMADTGESIIKKFVLYAGNLTASPTANSGYRKKIGTGTEISELWPEATADLNSSSNNVLIAEGSKLESHGGTLIASSGSLLGW